MVVLLAAVVIGGLVWLARLNRGRRTDRAHTDGAGPGFPGRPLGGKHVSPALMSHGRIEVCGLTKEYRGLRAVDDLSFTVEPGRVTGFLGPNDATLTPADDGGAFIAGADAVAIGEAALQAGVAIHQLVTQVPDLEAAFLELTAGKAAIR
jgi:hypothetical protein